MFRFRLGMSVKHFVIQVTIGCFLVLVQVQHDHQEETAMGSRRRVSITWEQRRELERLRDTTLDQSVRERATAVLLVSQGQAGQFVAQHALELPHRPDTVYEWLNRYLTEGVRGLTTRKRRKRKSDLLEREHTG